MKLVCSDVRRRLPLRDDEQDQELDAHLEGCSECARHANWHSSFDTLIRSELVATVPAALTARLLAAIPQLAAVPAPVVRPAKWHRQRRIAVVSAFVLAVVSIAMLMLGLNWIFDQAALSGVVDTVTSWPGQTVAWLYQTLPASRYVVDILLRLREPIQWLLIASFMWVVLDRTQVGRMPASQSQAA